MVATSGSRRFQIDARLEDLARLRTFVREVCEEMNAGDDCVVDVVQAVDEAATNVIRHGYAGRSGPIEVTLAEGDGAVRVEIADRAPAFDPTRVGAPDLTSAHVRPGGMGIHLIRAATDTMEHRPRPGGGNVLTLVRTLGRHGEEED
jgi:anti-sigma regulatory factor (Ser/Thr protein kinase)